MGGEVEYGGVAEGGSGAGEAGDHEAVPGGDDFVVEMGAGAFGASVEEGFAAAVEEGEDFFRGLLEVFGGFFGGDGTEEGVGAFEFAMGIAFGAGVAVAAGAEGVAEDAAFFLADEGVDFGGGPDVEGAFGFVIGVGGGEAVGVFGGVEATVGVGQVALDIGGDFLGHFGVEGGAGDEESFGEGVEELGLIIEHFFVMRNVPVAVDGVAMEAAAELVAQAAMGHGAEGAGGHFEGPVGFAGVRLDGLPLVMDSEEEVEGGGAGEFGGAAEAAFVVVEAGGKLVVGFLDDRGGGQFAGVGLGGVEVFLEFGDGFGGAFDDFFAVFGPGFVEFDEEVFEADAAVGVFGGEVGAAEEGFEVGGEEDGHGPAAAAGGGLNVGHVGEVDVGALFAVDFDGDEVVIDVSGDFLVLEGFAFHDVAPVAGGVAGGEEERFVFIAGFFEGGIAPGEPVHGVVSVLEEVGGRFVDQRVGVRFVGGAHGRKGCGRGNVRLGGGVARGIV